MVSTEPLVNKYRTVFISDIHLGTRMSQADQLLDFMKTFESEKIYLVGDIIDGWAMSKNKYWPQDHNDVIQKFLRKARKGTEIIYIPGNHDEFMRDYCDFEFGHIVLCKDAVHIGVDSKIYYVTHGDQFDVVVKNIKWLAHIGSWAYDFSIMLNVMFNRIRKIFNMEYWSLSAWLKYKVKEAVNFIGDYESSLSAYAKSKKFDGIICGHIHHPSLRYIDDILYLNCGDWVESCTAIVEHYDGKFEIIKWG
jgi:UDP-2,3-diacylglucosamine pyrophosphatase LpxH